jgi:TetR/AcrR family transcriptional regulator, transcriptional repressor for nem operon
VPRPRQFDESDAVERAMELFWRRGYEATSVADLSDHLGMGPGSLYNAFGSKHALFLASLDRYCHLGCARREALLEQAASPIAAIRAFFAAIVDEAVADPDRRGCLVANSALELAAHDPETARRVRADLRAAEDAFHLALVRAGAAGELAAGVDPRPMARSLVATLLGVRVLARSDPDRERLEDAVAAALRCLG